MTRVLVVDDEPQILRALRINLRARGYDVDVGRRRRRRAAGRRRQPPRPRRARPRPARHGRRRGHPRPARLDRRADHRAVRPRRQPTTRSRPSTPAPTTTSPSRSAMDELLARMRAVTRRAAPRRRASRRRRRSASFTVDLAAQPVTGDGRRRPPHPHRVAPARGAASATPASWSASASCCTRSGAAVRHRDQLPAPVHGPAAPQARDRPRPPPAPAHRARHGLPLPALSLPYRVAAGEPEPDERARGRRPRGTAPSRACGSARRGQHQDRVDQVDGGVGGLHVAADHVGLRRADGERPRRCRRRSTICFSRVGPEGAGQLRGRRVAAGSRGR